MPTETTNPPTQFRCEYASRCSGCGWHQTRYEQQISKKIEGFAKAWKQAGLPLLDFQPVFVSLGECGLRDRVDLIIDNRSGIQKIGMFDQEHKEIVDLANCAQLSAPLQKWYEEFRKVKWPIQRGSVRLRVSPDGDKGVWLDFANVDVKVLLDEKSILENLLQLATVEIGQRRKILVQIDQQLKLIDPIFKPWFETYIGHELRPLPLLCSIGGFTQPGFKANMELIKEVARLISQFKIKKVAEFGSGIGNFTLPLASLAESVDAFEIDRLACSALEENLRSTHFLEKVKIHQGDFQNLNERRNFNPAQFDAIFVDPPRSGLKSFLDPLFQSPTVPANFIYISCFPESFCFDAKRLYERGYQLKSVTIIDQFPQTAHAELVSYFSQ